MPLDRIAVEFEKLADRFELKAQQAVKAHHLAQDIGELRIQAGRLLVAAIDQCAFPESRATHNGGWWDRPTARVPGAWTGLIPWHASTDGPSPFSSPIFISEIEGDWPVA